MTAVTLLARTARSSSPARRACSAAGRAASCSTRGADVVGLDRRLGCRSGLAAAGADRTAASVRRRRPRPALRRAAARRDEVDTVIHLAAQTLVGAAHRGPGRHVRATTSRAHGRCSRPAGATPVVRRIVVASIATRPTATRRAPYDEDDGAPAATRTTSRRRAPTCSPRLRRDLRPARRDHPLRQHVRRRRPELEPHRPGHDPLASCAASAR